MSRNALKTTRDVMAERIRVLIAGMQKHPPVEPFTIRGQPYTAVSLAELLQGLSEAMAAADTTHAAWKAALQKVVTVNATVEPILTACRSWIVATHENAPDTLADFGVTARKARTPQTTEQAAAAIAKRKATRAARHTMGRKQKKSIKGDVTGVVVTPVTGDPAASP